MHWLHAQGFGYDDIRLAIGKAGAADRSWPLLQAAVGVAHHGLERDRGVIALRTTDGQYVEIGRPGDQTVLEPELFDQASDVLRQGGWLARELGLTRIEVDPERLGGAPSVKGYRWPVERVARVAADDEGRALLIEEYDLDERDVEESIRWTLAAAAL